ncbi:uncharacterized protein LOC124537975 [Vanessa cardui]|uniref:uncharacterized protein LOC124537975 n=1 Tax=Vanessa cardui TaxID=171605 RepID=UPI001F13D785|nr:uncharacterized protein LOC124537975 [Vanessa cardui]
MEEAKKIAYKYCIVPMCQSTTVKNPDKIFFRVPNNMTIRKKWCKVMKRDLIGPRSTKYVCEDHFDVENDTENLVKHRLVGGTLKLKPEIYPHKFECQKTATPQKERGACETRRQIEFHESLLTKEAPSTSSSFQCSEIIDCDAMESDETENPLSENLTFPESDNHPSKKRHKGVQVTIKRKQKNQAVQTIVTMISAKDTGNKCS